MKKTILVIEDEKVTRNNLLKFLQSEGFNALGAENGNIGVKLATQNLPDLIICDILMPEMDGYDVLFNLQQNSDTNTIPFIFLTVTSEKDFLAENEFFNQDDYLRKPVTSEQLRNAISSKLEPQSISFEDQSYLDQNEDLKQLQEQLEQLEKYSQAKDILLANLCENLKKYLPSLNQELEELANLSISPEQNNCLNKIQKDLVTMLTLINEVSELQQVITTENYQLLDNFELFNPKK